MKASRFSTTLKAERADTALAACSVPARYLWFGLRLIMADSAETGFLLVDGERPKPSLIATLTGSDPAQVKELLAELESHKVFVRDARGVAYCPTMVRAAKLRANGCRGGNPNLLARKADPALANQEDNQHRNQGRNQASRPESPKSLNANGNDGLDNQGPNQAPRSLIGESESGNPLSKTESLPKKPARKRASGGSTGFDREFEETFWPAYRRKTDKELSKAKFAAARRVASLDEIMAGLRAFDAWKDALGQGACTYPHPSTWLFRKRWTDELPAPDTAASAARCGTVIPPPEYGDLSFDPMADEPPPRPALKLVANGGGRSC